jgi:hypothetical protein
VTDPEVIAVPANGVDCVVDISSDGGTNVQWTLTERD